MNELCRSVDFPPESQVFPSINGRQTQAERHFVTSERFDHLEQLGIRLCALAFPAQGAELGSMSLSEGKRVHN